MSGGVPAGELLPCPFCGAGSPTVWLYREDRKPPVEPQWVAHCKGCNITQKRHRADHAITAWNTRATPTPPSRDADVERFCNPIVTCVDDEVYVLFDAPDQSIAPFCMDRDHAQALHTALSAALQALGERG